MEKIKEMIKEIDEQLPLIQKEIDRWKYQTVGLDGGAEVRNLHKRLYLLSYFKHLLEEFPNQMEAQCHYSEISHKDNGDRLHKGRSIAYDEAKLIFTNLLTDLLTPSSIRKEENK